MRGVLEDVRGDDGAEGLVGVRQGVHVAVERSVATVASDVDVDGTRDGRAKERYAQLAVGRPGAGVEQGLSTARCFGTREVGDRRGPHHNVEDVGPGAVECDCGQRVHDYLRRRYALPV